MKIEFNKNELKALIELLYFGDYMFSFSGNDYPEKKNKYAKLLHKIFNEAKKTGLTEHVAQYDKDELDFAVELEQNEDIQDIIDNYENDNFWMELIWRLAERDIVEKVGSEKFSEMGISKQIDIRFDTEEIYEREFEKYGLKNLRVLKPNLSF